MVETAVVDDEPMARHAHSTATSRHEAVACERGVSRAALEKFRHLSRAAMSLRLLRTADVAIGVTRDVTSRREAEQKALEILESMTSGFFAVERDWTLSYVNAEAERLVGLRREELLGMAIWDLPGTLDSPFEALYRRAMKGEPGEVEALWESGGRWLDIRAYPTRSGISIYVRDLTDQRELHEQLRQSQKMQAIGQLASGIVHDFNNSLQVIAGYAGLLHRALSETPHAEELEQLRSAVDRASGLTGQLLAFSRMQELHPQTIDLNVFLDGAAHRLQRLLGSRIHVERALEADAPTVEADPTQVEQIVLNLGANARDAMPEGGTFRISTSNIELDGAWLRGKEAAAGPGRYVCVRFTDSGAGIHRDIRDHLFEPFFTTKPRGAGTGLGLASVYGIVKQSGGYISAESEAGAGATFAVYLPVAG